jgi:hypothetical protein
MGQKEKQSKKILQKLINPYLVMIIDEESFEEQIQVRISRLKVIVFGLLFSGIFSGIIFTSIAYTPLKTYIPGYDSSELRKKAVQNLFLTDSLITLYNQNILYLNSIRETLTEDISFKIQRFLKKFLTRRYSHNNSFQNLYRRTLYYVFSLINKISITQK